MRVKKENIALAEKNSLSERTLATLQEEYESVLEKLDNCAEDNENLLEFNKSLKAQNQLNASWLDYSWVSVVGNKN